jgi:hypothetical protein
MVMVYWWGNTNRGELQFCNTNRGELQFCNTNRGELKFCNTNRGELKFFNPINAELNPICQLLALLGAHAIFHISRIRVKKILSQSHFVQHKSHMNWPGIKPGLLW